MGQVNLAETLSGRHQHNYVMSRVRDESKTGEIREARVLVREALALMEQIFDDFPENELFTKPQHSPSIRDDRSYFTDTTPFFTDASGEQLGVQQYFHETMRSHRREGWLGRLGFVDYRETVKVPGHYALVIDAGYGATTEYARVETHRSDERHDFIGHNGTRPEEPAHAWSGTIEDDRNVVAVLEAMRAAQLAGDTTLAVSL